MFFKDNVDDGMDYRISIADFYTNDVYENFSEEEKELIFLLKFLKDEIDIKKIHSELQFFLINKGYKFEDSNTNKRIEWEIQMGYKKRTFHP